MRKRDITRTLFHLVHPPTRFPRFCQPPPSIRLHLAAFGDETEPTPRITELSSRASRPRDATHFPLRSCVTLSWRRGLCPTTYATVDSFFFLFIDAELISLLFLFSFLPRQKVPFSRYGIRITFDRLRHGRQVERHQNRERRLTNVPRVIDSGN